VIVLAAAALLGGCGGGASAGPAPNLAVEAPDAVLRELGEPCSGGSPFLYAHATAPWKVVDASGKVVASGELPEGKAVEAFNHDPGVPRVPTYCRFEFHVDVAGGGRFALELPEGAPLPFSLKAGGKARVVLR
jgi:hypothetical protein